MYFLYRRGGEFEFELEEMNDEYEKWETRHGTMWRVA